MDLQLFTTPGLGDTSYLMISGEEAVLVDPQRDVWRFFEVAESQKFSIRYVLETHIHNDYVSGALEVQSLTGAEIAASAKGEYCFPHRPMAEGDEIQVGQIRLVAMETPGHTPEHLSWLMYRVEADDPIAVFTGGSLIVGSAGRTDLLGPEFTEELTRAQFRSLRRLAALPKKVQVLPTHGAGSFCASTTPSASRTSTVEEECRGNPALAAADEETFLQRQLSGLLAYPAYYKRMAPINRAGPSILGGLPRPRALTPEEVSRRVKSGAWVIDGRDRLLFAEAHLQGSINVELDSSFGCYVGWIVPFNQPLILVLPEPEEEALAEAVTQLIRIGYEQVEGYLAGGVDAWKTCGNPTRAYDVVDLHDLRSAHQAGDPIQVIDVRQQVEWQAGHIPSSLHLFLGDLPSQLDKVPKDKEVWTVCASGSRASIAASFLDRTGVPVKLVAQGGVPDWLASPKP